MQHFPPSNQLVDRNSFEVHVDFERNHHAPSVHPGRADHLEVGEWGKEHLVLALVLREKVDGGSPVDLPHTDLKDRSIPSAPAVLHRNLSLGSRAHERHFDASAAAGLVLGVVALREQHPAEAAEDQAARRDFLDARKLEDAAHDGVQRRHIPVPAEVLDGLFREPAEHSVVLDEHWTCVEAECDDLLLSEPCLRHLGQGHEVVEGFTLPDVCVA
mmetsp:Transcript_15150/g.35902  ORF Transcript_15150/g.35902 Transcript_15150/m.35902 type:complete len:215 (+) Transcript_15150:679-1323(+)